jgi:hypothetical protein
MTHTPLRSLGTGQETQRLIKALGRACDRRVSPAEDASAVMAEALERVDERLERLERTVAAKLGRPRDGRPVA